MTQEVMRERLIFFAKMIDEELHGNTVEMFYRGIFSQKGMMWLDQIYLVLFPFSHTTKSIIRQIIIDSKFGLLRKIKDAFNRFVDVVDSTHDDEMKKEIAVIKEMSFIEFSDENHYIPQSFQKNEKVLKEWDDFIKKINYKLPTNNAKMFLKKSFFAVIEKKIEAKFNYTELMYKFETEKKKEKILEQKSTILLPTQTKLLTPLEQNAKKINNVIDVDKTTETPQICQKIETIEKREKAEKIEEKAQEDLKKPIPNSERNVGKEPKKLTKVEEKIQVPVTPQKREEKIENAKTNTTLEAKKMEELNGSDGLREMECEYETSTALDNLDTEYESVLIEIADKLRRGYVFQDTSLVENCLGTITSCFN
ncbi:hypothetical protein EIN_283740 [Entamoeba invadens IP1]|uniref:Uncharacterized protein n=1 Tax=Entamoeba invadens IP1 TaxID=370355 RepID=L7FLU2_ENTIV|nr:hypothetical protein EIN_283740 [Entamoeba invadens IP1]ELP84828.1 hypothetical protein EIN_283740 [Entamoeba invadens IP1]|eukprot:XP_004184174.1 hypothetical protein EIN_283740 [Entamoeba invadens IP1]